MITIIHGTDQNTSRNQLNILKSKYGDTVFIDGNADMAVVRQNFDNAYLFYQENKKLLIFEKIFSQKAVNRPLLDLFKKISPNVDILIWEDKEIKTREFTAFSTGTRVLRYNLPVVIFRFLDNFFPGNAKTEISILNSLEISMTPEIILFMLIKQLRLLIQLKAKTASGSSELKTIMPWQKSKLINQSSYFTLDQLTGIYENLLTVDYESKAGLSDRNLINRLKMLIISLQ